MRVLVLPKKDFRFMCYPYMRESISTVDFEIRTDSLTTRIGLAASLTKDISVIYNDLLYLCDMGYNLNGSVRGRIGITQEDLNRLSTMYDFYREQVKESIETFVLPQGTTAACVRILAAVRQRNQFVRSIKSAQNKKFLGFFLITPTCLPMFSLLWLSMLINCMV
jgi:hypothetical protein